MLFATRALPFVVLHRCEIVVSAGFTYLIDHLPANGQVTELTCKAISALDET
jgi:hypothetical protein